MSSPVKNMRSVAAFVAVPLLTMAGVLAASEPAVLTIVFQFDGPSSDKSADEMRRELGSIMQDSGIRIEWRDHKRIGQSESFPNLMVVNFRGKCRMDPVPYLYDERGPLAFTYGTDGAILPFSEIECDHVRSTLQSAMHGGDYARSDLLFGRALGRVLAHELYHVLAATHSHAQYGVARRALSGSDLISDELRLTPSELQRIHPSADSR